MKPLYTEKGITEGGMKLSKELEGAILKIILPYILEKDYDPVHIEKIIHDCWRFEFMAQQSLHRIDKRSK